MQIFRCFIILVWLGATQAWDDAELEVFDVVEEVNQNFYTLLGVARDADATTIKKAFRKLSLVLHPDKSDAPDAEIQFRQLVAVHDILKDPKKRQCYENVLENGLPDWRQAIYYYRRVRKMGLREMAIILFVIITIGQYLVGWAVYFERKLTVDEYLSVQSKKSQKKQKKGKGDSAPVCFQEEFETYLVKPSVKDTLPCQVPRMLWFLFVSGPPLLFHTLRDYWHQHQLRKQQQLQQQQEESEEEAEVVPRAPRKRKTFVLPELKDDLSVENYTTTTNQPKPTMPPVISGGLWTDDDLVDLAKLVKKYPVGTTERWDKIGEAMNRPASEVAHMAHKLKDDILRNMGGQRSSDGSEVCEETEEVVAEEPRKVKTRGGKVGGGEGAEGTWSQVQQKALESALAKFPKGAAGDRWVKIAKCVPGKTKEECMIRYKHLVDMVKKKKEQDETESTGDNQVSSQPEETLSANGETKTDDSLQNCNSIT